jgi:pyridoxal phosphate enzyme (YggS family)
VHPRRFELLAFCSGGRRSIQLSYGCTPLTCLLQSIKTPALRTVYYHLDTGESSPRLPESLAQRLQSVNERIHNACADAGRDPAQVRLLAVTKIFLAEVIRHAYGLGLREFGENYVQEMERKAPVLTDLPDARFHLIGHLQSNKTKKTAQLFSCVDALDSAKLATRLNAEAKPLDVMIEIKLSDEESKSGAHESELPAIVEEIRNRCGNLTLRGLMTVPPWSEDAEQSRRYFARLRELAERHGIPELSMGMSNDLEVAIEEGATWVRVGTALFGRRRKP